MYGKILVSFGNYLLSEERKAKIENPENLNVVGDWDIANWTEANQDLASSLPSIHQIGDNVIAALGLGGRIDGKVRAVKIDKGIFKYDIEVEIQENSTIVIKDIDSGLVFGVDSEEIKTVKTDQ